MSKTNNPNSTDKKSIKQDSKDTRREFLKRFGLIGAGAAVGTTAIYSGYKFQQKKETVKVLSLEGKLIEIPKEQIYKAKLDNDALSKRGREGIAGKRWVMVIDLASCRNARKCVQSCQSAHDLRPHEYHINTLEMQDTPNTAPYYMPKPCQHCDNPPCVSVCPVDATFKRQDGIVLIDNERCIGCRFCMAACPYSARMFHWEEPFNSKEYKDKNEQYDHAMEHGELNLVNKLKKEIEYDVEKNVPQRKGTISKCLFSADRLRDGKLPSCVSACPNGVFYFGDQNEDAVTNGTTKETVRLSELLEENAGYQLMPELGTKPRVYYLPAKNRLFKFEKTETNNNEHHA
jgi:Fe-S-cluster-containing dehydrogenase component